MHSTRRLVALITLCSFLAACIPAQPSPCLPESNREQIKTLAIQPSAEAPEIKIGEIIKSRGEGAGKGAVVGAVGTLYGGLATGNPFGLLFALLALPVFTVGGAIYGAASSDSASTVSDKIETIRETMTASEIQRCFASDIKNELDGTTSGMTILENGETDSDETSYDALLVTRVRQLELTNRGALNNRKVVIKVSVSAELFDPAGKVLYQRTREYSSEQKSLTEWARLNVITVGDMLHVISQELARQIVNEFFIVACPDGSAIPGSAPALLPTKVI